MEKLYPANAKSKLCATIKCLLIAICCLVTRPAAAQLATVVCQGGTATFTAPSIANAGTVTWWDDQFTGSPIGSGQSFTTATMKPGVRTVYWYEYANLSLRKSAQVYLVPSADATFTADFAGCTNKAMNFKGPDIPTKTFLYCGGVDGAGKSASFPTTATDNITIEASIYWDGKGNADQWIMYNGDPGFNGYGIVLKGSTHKFSILLGGVAELTTNVSAVANKWAHLAAVRNNGTWVFYYDDSPVTPSNSTAAPNTPFGATGGFYIGNCQKSGYFSGFIDNAAIWTKALSLDDIDLYRIFDFSPQSGLAGFWLFNETDGGTTLQDGSGNGFNLTMSDVHDRGFYNTGYTWNFAGTPFNGAASPSFTFASGGFKNVTVNVTDMNGCTVSSSQNVAVNSSALAGVTASASNNNFCAGSTTNLTATGGGGSGDEVFSENFNQYVSNSWADNGWGITNFAGRAVFATSLNGASPAHTTLITPAFSTTGASSYSFTIVQFLKGGNGETAKIQISSDKSNWTDLATYTGSNGHGSAGNFITDLIAIPAAFVNKSTVYLQFKFDDDNTGDYELSTEWYIDNLIVITGNVKPAWSWVSDGGFTSNVQNPGSITPAASATYTVTASNGCTTSSSVQVTVKPTPTAAIAISGSGVCPGGASPVITFTGNNGISNEYLIKYAINGVQQQDLFTTPANNTVSVNAPTGTPGTFTYSLISILGGANNCTQSQSGSVDAVIRPLPSATISLQSAVCIGNAANYTLKGTNGTAPYIISTKNSIDPSFTISYTTDNTGSLQVPVGTTNPGTQTYTLQKVIDALGCTQNVSGSAQITVNNNPILFFTSPATPLFCKDSVTLAVFGASTYAWEPAVSLSASTGASVKAAPSTTTKYVVTGTQNGCTSTATQTITSAVLNLTVPRDTVMCSGGTLNLTSSGSTNITVFQEGFNTTLSGWTFQNYTSGYNNPEITDWTPQPNNLVYANRKLTATSSFYMSKSFYYNTLTIMQSPAFSTTGFTNMQVKLTDRVFYTADEADVQLSTDGTNWTDVLSRGTGPIDANFTTTTFSIPAAFENKPTVYLRFYYKVTNGTSWWGVDDIAITAQKPQTSFAWSSSPAGYSSSQQNPGNVSPLSTTIYTVSATNSSGCTPTASVKDSIVVIPVFTASMPVTAPTSVLTSLSYTITKGHPNKYSITPASPAMPGFVSVNDATLTSSPVAVTIPASAPNTYKFNVTMRDATLACAQSQILVSLPVLNNNNNITGLGISSGTLSPSFNTSITSYQVTEALGVSSVTVTPAVLDPNETITVNGIAVNNGSASQSIPLTNVTTVISVVAKAQDGSTKTYTITVKRPANISATSSADAKLAWSLRKLTPNYLHAAITPPAAVTGFTNATSPLVRVRRSADNALLDIGYLANGDIDTAQLKNFAGTGDAFVTIWYDQSGNNYDAFQTTAGSQPRIVHNGVVERKNSKPTVYFYGSAANNVYLNTVSFTGFDTAFAVFAAAGVNANNTNSYGNALVAKTKANLPGPWDFYSDKLLVGDGAAHYSVATMPVPFTAATPLAIWHYSGKQYNDYNIYVNGVSNSSLYPPDYADSNTPVVLGSRQDGNTRLDGWISEAVIFGSLLSESDRSAFTGNETSTYLSPYITSFNPVAATTGVITIKGGSFTGATAVSFGGVNAASFTVVDDNTITATLSGGASGNIAVTNAYGTAAKGGFFYGAAPGNAVKLNGTSQYITANTNGATVMDKFTVEAWVKPSQATALLTILSTRSGTDNSFDMKLQSGNTIHADIGNGSGWLSTNADATFNYSTGRWYHIAYVVTTTGYTIYANGKAVGNGSFAAGHPLLYDATHTVSIGAFAGNNEYFKGDIDEVRVYNEALTQAQVQADMQSTAIAVPGNLQLYYNFDQLTGPAITDFSNNNYAGTGTGSPVFEESYAMVVPVIKPATIITDTSFTANWQAAQTGTVNNYLLDVSANAGFTSFVGSYHNLAVNGTSLQVTGLSQHTSYYYRVRAEKISVTGQGAFADTASAVTLYTPPVITNFDAVTSGVNDGVQIKGTNLSNATAVSFGGVAATIVSNTSTTIIATVPSGNTSGAVAVTTAGGTAAKGGFYAGNMPANALYFDGVDDNVTLPSATINNLAGGTYEVWVNPASLRGTILSKQRNGVATNSVLSIGYFASAVGTPAEGTPGIVYFRSQNGKPLLASKTALQTGHWYHIAVVFNTINARVYINGQLDSTVAGDFSMPDVSDAVVSFGAWAGDGGGQFFKGRMDELRIYTTDRSSSLATDMTIFASSTGNNISSYYTFDAGIPGGDNTGNKTLYDLAVNSYNGTLNNFALNDTASNWVESYAMVLPVALPPTTIGGDRFFARWTPAGTGTVNNYIVDVSTDSTFAAYTSVTTLSGAASNQNITGLQPQKLYYFRVRANKGSVDGQGAYSNIVSTTTTALVTATISSTSTACKNTAASIIVKAAGGTGPYIITYKIDNGSNKTITTGAGDSALIAVSTSTQNTYTYKLVSVRDVNNANNTASATATITIVVPTTSTTLETICSGTSFNWNGVAYTTAGTYTAHLVNAAGCDSAATLVLTVAASPATAILKPAGNNFNLCYGSSRSISVTATSGASPYQYSVDGTTYQASGSFVVHAGDYMVTVKGANGCALNTNSITLIQPAAKLTYAILAYGSNQIIVNTTGGYGGYTYSLNGGAYQPSSVFTGVKAGDSIKISDNAGCTTVARFTAMAATVKSAGNKDSVCYGSTRTITATATGGVKPYQYSLDGITYQASTSFSVHAGTYSITVMDVTGATVTTSGITITQPAAKLTYTIQAGDGGVITVNTTGGYGGYTYSLNNGTYQPSNMFTGINTGDSIRVVDNAGCATTARFTALAASVKSAGNKDSVCYGSTRTITASATGGIKPYQYSLDGITYQTSTSFSVHAGAYSITVMDAAGATVTTNNITITQPAVKLSAALTKADVSCNGANDGIVTATAAGGFGSYLYSTDSINYQSSAVFSNLHAGAVKVYVKDAVSCATNKAITITQPATTCSSLGAGTGGSTSASAGMVNELKVKVLPNPTVTNFILTLLGGDDKKVVELRVMDMQGRMVYQTRGSVFDLYKFGQNFANGMYIAEVLNGNKVVRIKLVKGN